MTSHGLEEVAIDALRGGARDYLRKPFKLQELVTCADSVFAVRRDGLERRCDGYAQPLAEPSARGRPATNTANSRSILRVVPRRWRDVIQGRLEADNWIGREWIFARNAKAHPLG